MSTVSKVGSLAVAVLLTYDAQLLDMAPIDLFGMLSKDYLQQALPSPMQKLGLEVKIFYVGVEDSDLQNLTGQAKIQTNSTVQSPSVQPGEIDILLIPGPPPTLVATQSTINFVKAHATHGTTIMTVCTGCYIAAQAGILNGRKASGPRGLAPDLRAKFKDVKWDTDRRFVKDKGEGEIWTSGGITNGLEMVAAYIKEKWPGPLGETVCAMADVGEKGEFYDTSNSVDTAWWIGQIFRAVFQGKRR